MKSDYYHEWLKGFKDCYQIGDIETVANCSKDIGVVFENLPVTLVMP